MSWISHILLLSSCEGIERVPIIAAYHCAPDREATVACALDGDTVRLENCDSGEDVRMLGVDAPEIAHNSAEVDQCFGLDSAAYAAELLVGQSVRLSFDAECIDNDTYQRTLAYVFLLGEDYDSDDDDVLFNQLSIGTGHSRFYEEFGDIYRGQQLASAEIAAENAGLGLWAACE